MVKINLHVNLTFVTKGLNTRQLLRERENGHACTYNDDDDDDDSSDSDSHDVSGSITEPCNGANSNAGNSFQWS